MSRARLFDVDRKKRWTGSRALVVIADDECPVCGLAVDVETVDQRPLLRHGGYGSQRRTVTRHCRCGWHMESECSEVRP